MTSKSISQRICSIVGCNRPHLSRSWCKRHYEKWARYGDPLVVKHIYHDNEGRFWSKVDKSPGQGPDGECWEWTAGRAKRGYGKFTIKKITLVAHRYVFFLTHGYYPEPMGLHTCDNPPCCNPAHIIEGTHGGVT